MKARIEIAASDYSPRYGEWFRAEGWDAPMLCIHPRNVAMGLRIPTNTIAYVNQGGEIGFIEEGLYNLYPLEIRGGELVLVPA